MMKQQHFNPYLKLLNSIQNHQQKLKVREIKLVSVES